jgi:hypothetical protein
VGAVELQKQRDSQQDILSMQQELMTVDDEILIEYVDRNQLISRVKFHTFICGLSPYYR